MLAQLIIGTVMVALTIALQSLFLIVAAAVITRMGDWLMRPPHHVKNTIKLVGIALWIMAAHTVVVWFWAAAFIAVGAFDALEPALYFSVVTVTTLGFGDIVLDENWRLLGGIAAASGLMMYGISTAFLVEVMFRVRQGQTTAATAS